MRRQRPPFIIQGHVRGFAPGAAIPVAGVGQIALDAVQMGMYQGGGGVVLMFLDDGMRAFPVSLAGEPQGLQHRDQSRRRLIPQRRALKILHIHGGGGNGKDEGGRMKDEKEQYRVSIDYLVAVPLSFFASSLFASAAFQRPYCRPSAGLRRPDARIQLGALIAEKLLLHMPSAVTVEQMAE